MIDNDDDDDGDDDDDNDDDDDDDDDDATNAISRQNSECWGSWLSLRSFAIVGSNSQIPAH